MANNKNNTKKGGSPLGDFMPMVVGEAIVATLTCLGFLVADLTGLYRSFEYHEVILGAVLGAIVIIANHALLVFSVDREIKKFIANRPEGEMSEEDIALYSKKQSVSIQNAMRVSFIVRTVSLMLTLAVSFLTGWFNPIAAAIPLFAFRPILSVVDKMMRKHDKTPDPAKFIKYDDEEEKDEEEKEDN